MARGRMSLLFPEEIERIHLVSLRMLEKIGIQMRSESVGEMLLSAGAVKSENGNRILIPESMVKSALASVPKSILLASTDGKNDMTIPSKRLYASTGGEGVYLKNLVNGEVRATTLNDIKNVARIVEHFPQIDFFWGLVGALDVPDEYKGIMETVAGLQYTHKHQQGGALSAEEAQQQLELASIVAGGEKNLRKRPIISAVQCPLSPLIFEKGLTEAQVTFARAGIPVVAMVANLAGLTSPVTLSGTIAQTNAENLASLVITQVVAKGAPWIYSSDSVPANLRTGSIDYGAFEAQLMRTGAGEMGSSYGLPVMCAGVGIEGTSLSLGSIQEGVPHMVNQALVPSDLGSGFGGIDEAAGASFEQLVVDAWIWDIAKEIIREFETDDAAIAFDTIREASADMSFLSKKHTMARFRKEFLATAKPQAVLTGREDFGERGAVLRDAQKEVVNILGKEPVQAVPKDVAREMDEYIEDMKSK